MYLVQLTRLILLDKSSSSICISVIIYYYFIIIIIYLVLITFFILIFVVIITDLYYMSPQFHHIPVTSRSSARGGDGVSKTTYNIKSIEPEYLKQRTTLSQLN